MIGMRSASTKRGKNSKAEAVATNSTNCWIVVHGFQLWRRKHRQFRCADWCRRSAQRKPNFSASVNGPFSKSACTAESALRSRPSAGRTGRAPSSRKANLASTDSRVATSSLYQPGKAPSLRSGLRKPANPSAKAGVLATVLNMLGTTPRCAAERHTDRASSGGTWSRSSIGMRPLASFPPR